MRNSYFDNIKLVLIYFVVLGHLIEKTYNGNSLLYFTYFFIYIFHIPALTLIAGYFSKNKNSIISRMKKMMIYYIIFELLYAPFFYYDKSIFLIKPYWIMWFLLSLMLWNLMLTFFIKLKHPIVLAFIIGIASGYINSIGYVFSLSRTLVFFPFFILGYYLKETHFNKLNTNKIKTVSTITMIIIFVLVNQLELSHKWLLGSYSYAALNNLAWYAGIYRFGLYIVSLIFCVALFSLVPRKKYIFTYMGANTLNTYLLHGFLVLIISTLISNVDVHPVLLVTLAVALTALLSSNNVNRIINFVFEQIFKLLSLFNA